MNGAIDDALSLFPNPDEWSYLFPKFQIYSSAYRGYEPNGGWTSQAALTLDAVDLLDYALRTSSGQAGAKAFVGGWSMGAAVAAQLASAHPDKVAGLLLAAPWASFRTEVMMFVGSAVGPWGSLLWPWLWVADSWDTAVAVAALPADMPIVVISPRLDGIISPEQHQHVFESSHATNKWWLPCPGASHTEAVYSVLQPQSNLESLESWAKSSCKRTSTAC